MSSGPAAPESAAGPPLGRLVRRRWFLMLLGLGLGLGGGYYYFTQQEPVYRSAAEVAVTFRQKALPVEADTGAGRGGGYDPIGDYMHRLHTAPLIARAVAVGGLTELPRFRGGSSPVGTILASLSSQRLEGTRVIRISYEGKSPEESKAVVDAVVNAFVAMVRAEERSVSDETMALITEANDSVRRDLKQAQEEYRKFQAGSPLRATGGEGVNPHLAELEGIDSKRKTLRLEYDLLVAELAAIRRALASGDRRDVIALMASAIQNEDSRDAASDPRPGAAGIEAQLFELELQRETLLSTKGPRHPHVINIERQLAASRAFLNDGEVREVQKDRKPFLTLFVEARQERAKVMETQLASLNKRYDEVYEKAASLSGAVARDGELRAGVEQLRSMYDALVERISQLDLLKDADGVRVAELVPAGPGSATPDQLVRSLAMGGVLGLAIAFGLAYLLESADGSFKDPEELREAFGLPLLGHIPEMPGRAMRGVKGSRYDGSLLTVHRPKGRLAESFRAVRAGVLFSGRDGIRVIQVTSPDPGDGKSTLAANLAVSLARSGKSTVLVDADLRRPRVGKLFGLRRAEKGEQAPPDVVAAIEDPDVLHEALRDSGVDGLSILPCLSHPDHPAELLSSEAFERFVDQLEQKFAFVVIDTPPILAVSDPAAAAPHVDGVVLVSRLGKRTRGKLGEALDNLERAGANVLGLVVNGVESGSEYSRGIESGYYGGGYGGGYRSRKTGGGYYSDELAENPAVRRAKAPAPGPEPVPAGRGAGPDDAGKHKTNGHADHARGLNGYGVNGSGGAA